MHHKQLTDHSFIINKHKLNLTQWKAFSSGWYEVKTQEKNKPSSIYTTKQQTAEQGEA